MHVPTPAIRCEIPACPGGPRSRYQRTTPNAEDVGYTYKSKQVHQIHMRGSQLPACGARCIFLNLCHRGKDAGRRLHNGLVNVLSFFNYTVRGCACVGGGLKHDSVSSLIPRELMPSPRRIPIPSHRREEESKSGLFSAP